MWDDRGEFPEQTRELVLRIGKALNVPIKSDAIDYCHRLSKRKDGKPPTIIVKFVRRFDRHNFIMRRNIQRNLNLKNLNLGCTSEDPIYIHPSLTPFRSKLRYLASIKKKELNFQFLWVTLDGEIRMRKSETSRTYFIRNISDLDSLPTTNTSKDDTAKLHAPPTEASKNDSAKDTTSQGSSTSALNAEI